MVGSLSLSFLRLTPPPRPKKKYHGENSMRSLWTKTLPHHVLDIHITDEKTEAQGDSNLLKIVHLVYLSPRLVLCYLKAAVSLIPVSGWTPCYSWLPREKNPSVCAEICVHNSCYMLPLDKSALRQLKLVGRQKD